MKNHPRPLLPGRLMTAAVPAALLLAACGGSDDGLPQLSPATPATLLACTDLVTKISFPNTTITAATQVTAGTLTVAGQPVPEHCRVTGRMFDRVGPIDGAKYAIGFEMRLPKNWNGRSSTRAMAVLTAAWARPPVQ